MSSAAKPRPLSRGIWWAVGLAGASIGLVIAALLAIVQPAGRAGTSWGGGFGWPGFGWSAYGSAAAAYDVTALGELLEETDDLLGPGSGIRTVSVDNSGYGVIHACDGDDAGIIVSIEDWHVLEIETAETGCPALLSVADIDLAAVSSALQDASPYRGAWVEVSIGDLNGLVEPADEPYIMVSIDEWDQMFYTMDGEYVEFIAGSGYHDGTAMSAEDAATAIDEIVAAGELATASSMCWDGGIGWYTVIGQRADDATTSYEWVYDGGAWQMDAWSTGGPPPLPVDQLDLPGAIARIDELSPQWQHNFPVSSVCVDAVAGDTYHVTYRGYTASAERTVVTDAEGVVLHQS